MPSECTFTECRHSDPVKGCKVDGCTLGHFFTLINRELDLFGPWTVRRQTRSSDDVLVATTKGKGGRVEVWGGALHRTEVWAFPRKAEPIMVAHDCDAPDELRDAVERACAAIGKQGRLEL